MRSLVDIRAFPGSRRHPHMSREAMAAWLPDAGVEYSWEPRLGGRRTGATDSPNPALRNPAFRAYADHMATEDFRAALAAVLSSAVDTRTTVMCAEALWWECHRGLLSDALIVRGVLVRHIVSIAEAKPHELSGLARVRRRKVIYPGLL